MALQGNIDSFAVVDVLRLLGSSGKTGRLAVDGDRGGAALWMVDGRLVGGTSTRPGGPTVSPGPAEVLFDLLRFTEGSFVFEADVHDPAFDAGVPTEIEPAVAEAEVALGEWHEICAVVPSPDRRLALSRDLLVPVQVDGRRWAAVGAIAAGGRAATVDTLAEQLGLGELGAMRLARELVELGLVDVGDRVPSRPDRLVDPVADLIAEPPPYASPVWDTVGTVPDAVPDAVDDGRGRPLDTNADLEEIFGSFDPFGTAAEPIGDPFRPADLDLPAPAAGAVPVDAVPVDAVPVAGMPVDAVPVDAVQGPGADDGPDAVAGAPFDAEPPIGFLDDDAAADADLARQLAMLSPRAAEAVASADPSLQTSEEEERARVARFLGSV